MVLKGITVIEVAGSPPANFCGAILADFGATVIQVDKVAGSLVPDFVGHAKRNITIDLKTKEGVKSFRRLCKDSDVLIESFRNGVMENLGLGPKEVLSDNKRLIYARMTGFGRKGIYSQKAGHDINFLAMSGVLSMLGWEADKRPSPPIVMTSFSSGSMMCVLGILMALLDRTRSGLGQVVDCSIVAGNAYLASWIFNSRSSGIWSKPRGKNFLDGGAFFYDTYETKDGQWMAVAAVEPQFYSQLLDGLGLDEEKFPQICTTEDSEKFRKSFADIFKTKTRTEWCEVFSGRDACVTPVLSLDEATRHQHSIDNNIFSTNESGILSPNPAPVLSRTEPIKILKPIEPPIKYDNDQILDNLNIQNPEIERMEKFDVLLKSKL